MGELLDDSAFWLSITTIIIGSTALIIKTCYKSKCSNFKCCCGLIEIKRDTAVEEHIDIENRRDTIPPAEN